jgi:3-isopropylmalate/(R)-2-methylmalate dehydratase small subunit
VVAPSFADIFRGNAISAGLVPAQVTEDAAARLAAALEEKPDAEVVVDVAARTVSVGAEVTESFQLADYAQWRLLEGFDDVGLTLRHEDAIAAYERQRPEYLPSLG